MSTPLEHLALRRKIAAHARATATPPDVSAAAGVAFGRALRRAGAAFDGLGLMLGPVTVDPAQTLDGATAALPAQGLIAALEDGAGRRGLIGLSSGLVDALIEVQTTGRLDAAELPPRPITRIDEALTRDFVDLALAAFAQEGQGLDGRNWPDRMGYGSRIRDRGQINLLLPDGPYTCLQAEVGFDGVDRRARMIIALPRAVVNSATQQAGPMKPADPAWLAARARILAELRIPLDVVLLRLTRPLAEVQRLAVGDLLFFSDADLQQVALENDLGRPILHGRLGQVGGWRALRLAGAAPHLVPEHQAAASRADADPSAQSLPRALAPVAPAALVAKV
jgi:flagellar motor switch protein FliM